MLIFNSQSDLSAQLQNAIAAGGTIGFVPTMGALHEGHLSLLTQSVKENDHTVISIFVNPTQFNNLDDLAKYPRTLELDVEKIRTVDARILVFAPSVEEIYEGKTESVHFDFDGLENQMEGRFRPGHFDGVGTIVKKLFQIVKPNRAYFGEKDFQQLQIVKKMVEKEGFDVKVIGCPIYREHNGLAMSSRNERLTAQQRADAAIIYQTLKAAKRRFGTESAMRVTQFVKDIFERATGFELEYFEIADETTLLPIGKKIKGGNYRAFIAVFVNNIRLIDTVSLTAS